MDLQMALRIAPVCASRFTLQLDHQDMEGDIAVMFLHYISLHTMSLFTHSTNIVPTMFQIRSHGGGYSCKQGHTVLVLADYSPLRHLGVTQPWQTQCRTPQRQPELSRKVSFATKRQDTEVPRAIAT